MKDIFLMCCEVFGRQYKADIASKTRVHAVDDLSAPEFFFAELERSETSVSSVTFLALSHAELVPRDPRPFLGGLLRTRDLHAAILIRVDSSTRAPFADA